MDKFDIKRFALTAKWTLGAQYKEIMTITGTMFIIYMLQFFNWMWPMIKGSQYLSDTAPTSQVMKCVILYLLFLMTGGCWIFNNMKTKEQRIAFKMLPASDLEKFAVRFLYVTVAFCLMGFAAFCLADILRMGICLISGFGLVRCAIPDFITIWLTGHDASGNLLVSDMPPASLQLAGTGLAVWIHSTYILGGALFRRRQFVLTSCVHLIMGTLFLTVAVTDDGFTGSVHSEEQIHLILYAAAALLTALGTLNWWLAYRIFKRMQIINNKWINV